MKLLVTGGAGFIGSAVVRRAIAERGWSVVNLDALTYAANPANVAGVADDPRYAFEHADIRDGQALGRIFTEHRPDAVMHLAAESHVDRSIDGPMAFVDTNVAGAARLLTAARDYWETLETEAKSRFRFHHVSTDEVYGSLGGTGLFTEDSAYRPNSPYAASKAASDMLVRAWGETYGLPVVISNCSNNYGPYQFPEKLVPVVIVKALAGEPIPVYGEGLNVRDWLHVDDHAEALLTVLTCGRTGRTYNVGARAEMTNIALVERLCAILDDLRPRAAGRHADLIDFVDDRPGHDARYAIDPSRIETELGWRAAIGPDDGLRSTVQWYLDNQPWWRAILDRHGATRIGLGGKPRR